MPDGFQAEPPRWSSEPPSAYRYSEVNLRKPDKQAPGVRWAIIAVAAAFLSVGLIGVFIFALLLPSTAPVTVIPPSTAPFRVITPPDAMKALKGTWIATAATIDGEEATDDNVAKIKLTMDSEGFKMVLPTTQKEGTWETGFVNNPKGILFVGSDDETRRAIYDIDGDTLNLCIGSIPNKWPDDFTAEKGSKRILLVLKRKEP